MRIHVNLGDNRPWTPIPHYLPTESDCLSQKLSRRGFLGKVAECLVDSARPMFQTLKHEDGDLLRLVR